MCARRSCLLILTMLLASSTGCSHAACPAQMPQPPRPPAVITVTADPPPCPLPPLPGPLAATGALKLIGGRWALLDVADHQVVVNYPDGIAVPRHAWDEMGIYIAALQSWIALASPCVGIGAAAPHVDEVDEAPPSSP